MSSSLRPLPGRNPSLASLRRALFAVGCTSIIGQIVLIRELVAVFYGNELVLGVILATWLLWVAVGAWRLPRFRADSRVFTRIYLLPVVILPAQIAIVRAIPDLIGATPGSFIAFPTIVWTTALVLAPLCLLVGYQFALGARLLLQGGRTAGEAYAWESLGAVVGGALFSFVLVERVIPFQIALGVGVVNLLVALDLPQRRNWRAVAGALAVVGAILVVPLGDTLRQETLSRQFPGLVLSEDSRYGRLTVTALGHQRSFYENGLLMFSTGDTFAEEVAHISLLTHPAPRRVLLVGGGVGGVLREALKHHPDQITYLELDPLIIRRAREQLPPEEAAALDDARVRLVVADGRRWIKTTAEIYDVIIINLPEPSTGQLNRFYTREFFEEAKAVLAPDGVFVVGLPSAENYWSPELARRNSSVYRTLGEVFPHILATPGGHNFFLASPQPLPSDASIWVERYETRGIETLFVQAPYLEYLFATTRFDQVRASLESETGVRVNRDLAPICYYYDMALWLSLFGSGLRGAFEAASLLKLAWLLPLPVIGAFWLRRRRAALPVTVGLAGFAMMGLEIVVLLAFQALHGYAYYAVGLIATAFMGGLAVGAALGARLAVEQLRFTQVGLAGYAVLLPAVLTVSLPAPHLSFALLALVGGALGGIVFPLAARQRPPESVGALYAVDLVGGCLGAVLVAGLLVPVVGITQTCLAVAALGLTGAILTW